MDDMWNNYYEIHKNYEGWDKYPLFLLENFFKSASKSGLVKVPDVVSRNEDPDGPFFTLTWYNHNFFILLDEKGLEITALRPHKKPNTIFFKDHGRCAEYMVDNHEYYFDDCLEK